MPRKLPPPTASGAIVLPVGEQTYVYRAYCQCGDLLYVGITRQLFNRLATHARSRSPWELSAVRLDWELYPTRAQAETVESHLIRTQHPVHNVQGRARYGRRQWLPPVAAPPTFDESARAAHRLLARGDRV